MSEDSTNKALAELAEQLESLADRRDWVERKIRSYHEIKSPYALTTKHLTRLVDYLQKQYKKIVFDAKCTDGTSFSFEYEQLEKYPNPDYRRIIELTIRATKLHPEPDDNSLPRFRATLKFSAPLLNLSSSLYSYEKNILNGGKIEVEGDDERSVVIYDEVKRLLASMEPTYKSRLQSILSGKWYWFGIIVLGVLISNGISVLIKLITPNHSQDWHQYFFAVTMVANLIVGMAFGKRLTSIQKKALLTYPPYLIALGDQEAIFSEASRATNSWKNNWDSLGISIVGGLITTGLLNIVSFFKV